MSKVVRSLGRKGPYVSPPTERPKRTILALALLLVAAAGCGGRAPEAQTPEPTAPAASPADAPVEEVATTPSDDGWADPHASDDGWADPEAAPGAPAAKHGGAPKHGGPETRTMDVVVEVVKQNREKVRVCYDEVQKDKPHLKGDIVIRFVIDPDGKVQRGQYVQAESTIYSPEISDCMIAEIKTWKFPPSSRRMQSEINYPFNFNPRPPKKDP